MLLAVDTSTAQVGLAVYDGAQVIGEYAWRSSQRHTVELAPALAELLARCGLTMADVRALGVALGPGSFTSLRVGLSLVKGLALARHLPWSVFRRWISWLPRSLLPNSRCWSRSRPGAANWLSAGIKAQKTAGRPKAWRES
jgi:hypothetical protein